MTARHPHDDDHEGCETYDPDDDDGLDPGEDCGRWRNGRLSRDCLLAGTEQCDFECPYR